MSHLYTFISEGVAHVHMTCLIQTPPYHTCWTCTCCAKRCYIYTHTYDMSHPNTSISDMPISGMLCRGVFYLGICAYEMSHLNTSITGMFNWKCWTYTSYLGTSTNVLDLHMPGLHGQGQNGMKSQPRMAAVTAKQGENQC